MAEKSFPFAAVNEDRMYSAADWAAYFAQLVTNGVYPVGAQLLVTAASGMQVNVSAGGAWLNGYGYVNGSAYTLSIDAADGVLNRIDRIVVRWGRVERAIFLDVLKGTAASSPSAPALVRDADYYDLCIAQISIPAGITEITGAHISDKRLDPDLCGIVSSLITPDTAGWFEGLEAEFLTWFNTVKDIMDGDPDTNIVNAIAVLQEDVGALEASNAPLISGGTAPDFTVSPSPAILGYTDGQIWTVQFHADSDVPTLNVNGKGAALIYQYTGKAAKVKAGQIARVMRLGSSFFTVSGGGIGLPPTIQPGETRIVKLISYFSQSSATYISAGRGFTAAKAGTYRFTYNVYGQSAGSAGDGYVKLTKNGADVPGSEFTNPGWRISAYKTIDVVLNAWDVVVLKIKNGSYGTPITEYFAVSIIAQDIQDELNSLGVLNAG